MSNDKPSREELILNEIGRLETECKIIEETLNEHQDNVYISIAYSSELRLIKRMIYILKILVS